MRDRVTGQGQLPRRDFVMGTMLGAIGEALAGPLFAVPSEGPVTSQPATRVGESPIRPLVPWIYVHSPLEHWMSDYQRTFDAWADGGVRGIIVGPLRFFQNVPQYEMSYLYQHAGAMFPTFPPDPKIYASLGVAPPPVEPRDPKKEKQLQAMLDDAASRGWEILLFGSGQQGGARPLEEDSFNAIGFAAGVQDTMNAFPQARGIVIDGPGEHSYELAFHHGGEVFEIPEQEKPRLAHLGVDISRMERGIAHLSDRLHHLTSAGVRYYSPGGMLGGLALFDLNEDSLYWLRTRQETSLRYMAAVRQQIDRLNRKVKLGGIVRTSTFSLLTSQDYQKMYPYFDHVFPKLYFWNRGFDGMYGTLARWVEKISEWNPGLSESDSFAVVKSWFGIELPGIRSLADMDQVGFPDAFFSEIVYSEVRRALDAMGNDENVIAWVSTGRHPHAGDPMPSEELHSLLVASQRAGLKRFVYHPDPDLGAPEWDVISGLCGKRWKEDPDGYWPSDTPKPDTWNNGRKPRSPR